MIISSIFVAASPFPKRVALQFGVDTINCDAAETISSVRVPQRIFTSSSTVSFHSVLSHGYARSAKEKASFCIPPRSVKINLEAFSSISMSK